MTASFATVAAEEDGLDFVVHNGFDELLFVSWGAPGSDVENWGFRANGRWLGLRPSSPLTTETAVFRPLKLKRRCSTRSTSPLQIIYIKRRALEALVQNGPATTICTIVANAEETGPYAIS